MSIYLILARFQNVWKRSVDGNVVLLIPLRTFFADHKQLATARLRLYLGDNLNAIGTKFNRTAFRLPLYGSLRQWTGR